MAIHSNTYGTSYISSVNLATTNLSCPYPITPITYTNQLAPLSKYCAQDVYMHHENSAQIIKGILSICPAMSIFNVLIDLFMSVCIGIRSYGLHAHPA